MGSFGFWHWVIVLVIVLIVFGPSRLPNLGKSIGKAIRGFKDEMNTIDAEAEPVREARTEKLESAARPSAGSTQGKTQATDKKSGHTES